MPAPSTSTFALRGRPESAGRVPAGPAIKSHEESAVMTSDEPPTAPRWPRNRRRVSAERERDERIVVMLYSECAAGGQVETAIHGIASVLPALHITFISYRPLTTLHPRNKLAQSFGSWGWLCLLPA